MIALDFLKEQCNIKSENDYINYRPYECGSLIKTISVKQAVEMINKDIEEMIEIFDSFGLAKEQAIQGTFDVWKKRLAVFS